MPAFLIADIRIINREKYDEYRRRFRACVERFGGTFLARGQEPEIIQGGWHPPRMLLVQFARRADADAMIASDEYRELEVVRANCGMFDIVLTDGLARARFSGGEAVYAIADTRIVNRAAFEEYRKRIDQGVRAHRGRYLALSDAITPVAGNWAPTFLSIMEFPRREDAMAAHTASGYQELRDRVNNTAMIDMVLLAGREADTPA
ncbi:MAG: DUF1330 domain-containing protein [Burkholderiales bacterium]|nr:DUF1330 domain-containing protein [Burkholderiales bacterium]